MSGEQLQSNRPWDSAAEAAQARFLDKYFYAYMRQYGYTWERENGREPQLQGIDGRLSWKGKTRNVDEKGAFHYFNSGLSTFAFELSSIQHGTEVVGWFLNDDLKTDYYFITWPNGKCSQKIGGAWKACCINSNGRSITEDDFTIVEGMLIRRKSLIDMLNADGLSRDVLNQYVSDVREGKVLSKKIPQVRGYSLRHSPSERKDGYIGKIYAESPINLLVYKYKLLDVASGVYLISRDGVGIIKDKRLGLINVSGK